MLLNPDSWQDQISEDSFSMQIVNYKYHCFQFVSLKSALDINRTI